VNPLEIVSKSLSVMRQERMEKELLVMVDVGSRVL